MYTMDPNALPLELTMKGVPRLDLIVDRRFISSFLVDTGAFASFIRRSELEKNGMEELIVPDTEDPSRGWIQVSIYSSKGDLISDAFWFIVLPNVELNLLGMDFLSSTRSVLVLDPVRPCLWLNDRPSNTSEFYALSADVEVNGIMTNAQVDTGCSDFLACTQKCAETLQLHLQKRAEPIAVQMVKGYFNADLEARDVSLKGFGREGKGRLRIVPVIGLLIGLPFLLGATIWF